MKSERHSKFLAGLVASLVVLSLVFSPALAAAGDTIRVSLASDGTQGNYYSRDLSISADGRYVAFASYASNLVSGDTNGTPDVFIHDRQGGGTTRVSVASDGTQGNWDSWYSSISADGRYVAFYSGASNLVSGDTNGTDDVFVHDGQTGQTTRVSVASDGAQGNDISWDPSISADGRYVAFYSDATNLVSGDTNGTDDVFVHDWQTGQTTRISVASDGAQGNEGSWYSSISADGRYVAFYSGASNLVSGDTNGVGDVFVHETGGTSVYTVSGRVTDGSSNGIAGVSISDGAGHTASTDSNGNYTLSGLAAGTYTITPSKSGYTFSPASLPVTVPPDSTGQDFTGTIAPPTGKPIILVHGWQGLSKTGGFQCNQGVQIYNGANSTLDVEDGTPDLADWLVSGGYQVWIAHLDSTPAYTPSLESNAECLRNQIDTVYFYNSQPITLISHSMGGLVSRAAIRSLSNPGTKVEALYTMGSPHAGVPSDIAYILGLNSICLSQTAGCEMSVANMIFFNATNPNLPGVSYDFISGDADTGIQGQIAQIFVGRNDGFVGRYSGVGWAYPLWTFVPPFWPSASAPGQYWVDETHVDGWANGHHSYYSAPSGQQSDTFTCIKSLMHGDPLTGCWQVYAPLQPLDAQSTPPALSAFTELKTGHLVATQPISIPLAVDTNTASVFYLTWIGDKPAFTLTRPDSQIIDPAYALAHPTEVTYEEFAGGADVAPYAAYSFPATQAGQWQLNITAAGAVDYQAFAALETSRTFTAQTNADLYQIGDTAAITANLANGGTGLSGATVTAKLTRPDAVVDTIPLTDQGNGTYIANYVIPNSSGYLTIDITASGTDSGTAFTRQKHLQVAIQSDKLQLTGVYGDIPNDDNADGLYEKLDFTAQVNLTSTGEYAVTADLYVGNQFVTQIGDFFNLTTGTQTITLPFDGDSIRQSMLNGPYTITNLSLTPLDTGITAQSATNVHTTSAYSYTQFGSYAIVYNLFLPLILR